VQAPAQYADVPLSLYYLATLVLVGWAARAQAPGKPLVLAGAFASLAAWTKNEGIAFLVLVLAGFFLVEWRIAGWSAAFRKWRLLVLGAAPAMVMVAVLKVWLIPGREPALAQPVWEAAGKLGQFDRYAMIAKALWDETLKLGLGLGHPLVLLGILAGSLGILRPRQWRGPAAFALLTMGLSFAAYCGVYLITPQDLNWQLSTTVGRLYAQLWPGFLWAAFLVLKRVEDRLKPAEPRRDSRAERRKQRGARRQP